jgi:hypothetical protein
VVCVAAGTGAVDVDTLMVRCDAAFKAAPESEAGVEAGPTTVEVAGSMVGAGARTGRAWLRTASKRTAAMRSTQRGTTSVFLVLTMPPI